MDVQYCANCDTEAMYFVDHTHWKTSLCFTCKSAYEWGQASPEVSIRPIEEWEDGNSE